MVSRLTISVGNFGGKAEIKVRIVETGFSSVLAPRRNPANPPNGSSSHLLWVLQVSFLFLPSLSAIRSWALKWATRSTVEQAVDWWRFWHLDGSLPLCAPVFSISSSLIATGSWAHKRILWRHPLDGGPSSVRNPHLRGVNQMSVPNHFKSDRVLKRVVRVRGEHYFRGVTHALSTFWQSPPIASNLV